MNRSSCASGRAKVPSYSIGFCVAMTMNGVGIGYVTPSIVACRSSMHSSSALCVFGVARLISSARTTWAMIGPGRNSNSVRLLVEDREAGHVRREEVGRELDAPERAADALARALWPASSCRRPVRPRSGCGPGRAGRRAPSGPRRACRRSRARRWPRRARPAAGRSSRWSALPCLGTWAPRHGARCRKTILRTVTERFRRAQPPGRGL